MKHTLSETCSQIRAIAMSPGSLLEKLQFLTGPRPADSETLGVGPGMFPEAPGESDAAKV